MPNVPLTCYSFHAMVVVGIFFILFFLYLIVANAKGWLPKQKWVLRLGVFSVLMAYVGGQAGWIVAEVGRQPWVIQDIMPSYAAISSIEVGAVQTTFFMFAILFTVLLVAEIGIMIRQIKKGAEH
jgi:cytochrome d ubiquinol oxidase subunit I